MEDLFGDYSGDGAPRDVGVAANPTETIESLLRSLVDRVDANHRLLASRSLAMGGDQAGGASSSYDSYLRGLATNVLAYKQAVGSEEHAAQQTLASSAIWQPRRADDDELPMVSAHSSRSFTTAGREMRLQQEEEGEDGMADEGRVSLITPVRGLVRAADEDEDVFNAPAPSVRYSEGPSAQLGDSESSYTSDGGGSRIVGGVQACVLGLIRKSAILRAIGSHTYDSHHPLITSMDLAYIALTAVATIIVLDLLSANYYHESAANNAPAEGSAGWSQQVAILFFVQVFFTVWMLMRPIVRKRGRGVGRRGTVLEGGSDSGHHNGRQRGLGVRRRFMGRFSSVSEWVVLDTPKALWVEYIRTWFWFDALVTVPWNLPYYLSFGLVLPQSFLAVSSSVHLLRWIRAMTIGRSSEPLVASRRYLRFVRMFCGIVAFAHFCALLFPIMNPSLNLSYVAALYYIMTTMTSVGYGDITPAGTDGMVFAIVIMVIGVAAVGVLTASLTHYLNTKSYGQDQLEAMKVRMDGQLNGQFNVPREAKKVLTRYFADAAAVREFEGFWADLRRFPPHTRLRVEPFIVADLLANALLRGAGGCGPSVAGAQRLPPPSGIVQRQLVSWLQQLAEETVSMSAATRLDTKGRVACGTPLPFPPLHRYLYRRRAVRGEVLLHAGDLVDGLYLVLEGTVDVFGPMVACRSRQGGHGDGAASGGALFDYANRRSIAVMRGGQTIAAMAAFMPCIAASTVRCVSDHCEVVILSREWVLTAMAMAQQQVDSGSIDRDDSVTSLNGDSISGGAGASSLPQYLCSRREELLRLSREESRDATDAFEPHAASDAVASVTPRTLVGQISAVLSGVALEGYGDPRVFPIAIPLSLF